MTQVRCELYHRCIIDTTVPGNAVLMQAMNGDTISPEQEQSYSADKSLLVVSMQFESASSRNVVMLQQHRYRDTKDKLPVQECSKHLPDKDELVVNCK